MYTVAIVDDIASEGAELARLLSETPQANQLTVVPFCRADELLQRVEAGWRPDLLFMDIRLAQDAGAVVSPSAGFADGKTPAPAAALAPAVPEFTAASPFAAPTGIDVVARLHELGLTAPVVYMSGYDSCHTAVYRTNHACYLRKPFVPAEVAEALSYAISAHERWAASPLRLRVGSSERVLQPNDIYYLESRLRRLCVHTEHEELETYSKLGDVLAALPAQFTRCHQSFAVNLDHVAELTPETLVLTNGSTVPVSRRWRPQVRAALFAHIRAGR